MLIRRCPTLPAHWKMSFSGYFHYMSFARPRSIPFLNNTFMMYISGAMDSERLKVEIKSGFYNFFRALALVALWLVCDENSQVNGIVTLMDMSDMSLEHMSAIFSKDHCRKYSRLHQVISTPQLVKTYRLTCAPNEDSDQPARPLRLTSVFIVRMEKLCILGYLKCYQWWFWSDWAN